MDEKLTNIFGLINKVLKKKYPNYSGLYLFGSQVNGNATSQSDCDAAFIFDGIIDRKIRNDVISIVYDYELENDIVIDVMVFSRKEIDNPVTPLRYNIKTQGIFCYAGI